MATGVLLRRVLGACFFTCALFLASSTSAQTFEGCRVGQTPIQSVPAQIPDIAMATFQHGQPTIFVNPGVASFLSMLMRRFVYWHECAHHVLGHTAAAAMGVTRPYVDEQEADCWSIRHLVNDEGVADVEIFRLQTEAARTLGRAGDATHLPAIIRALKIRECLRSGLGGDAPLDGSGGSPNQCRPVMRTQTVMQRRMIPVTQVIACSHPVCHPYSGCFPAHAQGDIVTRLLEQQVPVQVPVTGQDCSGSVSSRRIPISDADNASSGSSSAPSDTSSWRFEYQRIGSQHRFKSRLYSSKEACEAAQERRNESPNYTADDCEEVESK
jgi:hypothetical protein